MTSVGESGAAAPSGVSAGSQSIKEEPATSMGGNHSHRFKLKLDSDKSETYILTCTHPSTVLEAIKSDSCCLDMYKEKNFHDSAIMIEKGKGEKYCVIATHFPCFLIGNNELLTLRKYAVTDGPFEQPDEDQSERSFLLRKQYRVFYIDTKGGQNAKTKTLFTNNAFKDFKYMCVYADVSITVGEALRRDGRFCKMPDKFTLTDNKNSTECIPSSQTVRSLNDNGEYMIRLPRGKAKDKDKSLQAEQPQMTLSEETGEGAAAEAAHPSIHPASPARPSEFQHKSKADSQSNDTPLEEIYQILCDQFADLKKWMESRFPGDSLLKALKLWQGNFGKLQQVFSDFYRLSQLIERGRSVCKITVVSEEICEGTGFVLVDRYVLTNAHLFDKCVDENNQPKSTNVSATFNYEKPDRIPPQVIPVKCIHAFSRSEESGYFDYAVLELEAGATAVPPGLLVDLGPAPEDEDAGACIIGHPGGGLKKVDLTWVIKEKERGESAGSQVTGDITMIIERALMLKEEKIESILPGGDRADRVVTYNTFMYHGSSGSPVFDADGRVFGLHTRGYGYQRQQNDRESTVIVCAQRLDNIIKDLKSKLKGKASDLWWKIQHQRGKSPYLQSLLESDNAMEVDGVLGQGGFHVDLSCISAHPHPLTQE